MTQPKGRSEEAQTALEEAGHKLYQLWFENPRVPMPHWKDLPEETREAVCSIALRVIQRYDAAMRAYDSAP